MIDSCLIMLKMKVLRHGLIMTVMLLIIAYLACSDSNYELVLKQQQFSCPKETNFNNDDLIVELVELDADDTSDA